MKKNFTPRKRKPAEAKDVLESTLNRMRLSKKLERYEGFSYWPTVVGEELACVSKPEKIIRNNVLVVRVKDAAWVQELSMQKLNILDSLHKLSIGTVIEDVRFITGDPKDFKDKE